jgi:hypothetical protein
MRNDAFQKKHDLPGKNDSLSDNVRQIAWKHKETDVGAMSYCTLRAYRCHINILAMKWHDDLMKKSMINGILVCFYLINAQLVV